MASVKLNATIQTEMLARIDDYCDTKGMTRSAFLSMAAAQYLDAIEKQPVVMDSFATMADLFKLAIKGKADSAEYAEKLEQLEASNKIIRKK